MTTLEEACVRAARELAIRLCKDAIWIDDQCTWIGLEMVPGHEVPEIVACSLRADLYGGTAGVAYFLSDIFASTGEAEFKRLAAGAVRHALASGRAKHFGPVGLYDGLAGIAFSAFYCGRILSDAEIATSARELLCSVADDAESLVPDVISGVAGLINAIVTLSQESEIQIQAPRRCRQLSESLRSQVLRSGGWPSSLPDQRALTGYSHGAGGCSVALIESARLLDEPALVEAAERGFAFEDSHFSSSNNNWADLRDSRHGSRSGGMAWCHGAPGVLLSRARAIELGVSSALPAAKVALRATMAGLQELLKIGDFDLTLCHGISGLLGIAEYGSSILHERSIEALIRSAMTALCDQILSEERLPNSFSKEEDVPQLMTGIAGIGHLLLQYAGCSSVPWILHPPAQLRRSVRNQSATRPN
jgi:lantibiotic modifying enzyme